MAREKVWVVRPSDGTTLADILQRAGEGPAAVADGRVFVGKRRATRMDQPVRPGDTVRIGARAPRTAEPDAPVEILLQRGGLVACAKPAGVPAVPDHGSGARSLVDRLAETLRVPASELRITSRLDRGVSGVVVFALDARSEDRLRAARAAGHYHRRYLAITSSGASLEPAGTWTAPIGRASDALLRAAFGADAKEATTRWARVALSPGGFAVLAVDPVTGRTHQIRIHASHAGAPLVGDPDYGGPRRITLPDGRVLAPPRIALHAARVTVPGDDGPFVAEAPVPADLAELWSALSGDPGAWASAIALAPLG